MSTYYVNPNSGLDSPNNGSSTSPWKTINKAVQSAYAGDTVIFVGNYTITDQYFDIIRSGTESNKITFKCETGSQTIIDYRNGIAIWSNGYDYINIEGFKFIAKQFVEMPNSDGWTFKNCIFRHYDKNNASYCNNPVMYIKNSTYNKIIGCDIEGSFVIGQDMIAFHNASHHNLVENCILHDTAHFLVIMDGLNGTWGDYQGIETDPSINPHHNIVRNCYLKNIWHSGLGSEIGGWWNVFEGNYIERCGSGEESYAGDPNKVDNEVGMGMYCMQKNGVIRNTVVRKSGGYKGTIYPGLWTRADQSGWSKGNNDVEHLRIYNNVFYDNYGCAISTGYYNRYNTTPLPTFADNKYYNNIIVKNGESTNYLDAPTAVFYDNNADLATYPFGNNTAWNDEWKNNLIEEPSNVKVIEYSNEISCSVDLANNGAITYLPNVQFDNNIQANISNIFLNSSQLGNEVEYDINNKNLFKLSDTSPCKSTGINLTTTDGSGTNSNTVKVKDSLFFIGGSNPNNWNGIITGDIIRVGNEVVTILSIDYTTNILTINRSISWANGTPVNLNFNGTTPSMGLIFDNNETTNEYDYIVDKNNGTYSGVVTLTSIAQLNSTNIVSGSIVGFVGGQQFNDAQLICKNGVTYKTYGTTNAIIGSVSSNFNPTVYIVFVNNVTLENLTIYSGNYGITHSQSYLGTSPHAVSNFGQNFIIKNCKIIGGNSAHKNNNTAIFDNTCKNSKIQNNDISGFYFGIEVYDPENSDISYNKIYNIWYENGSPSAGGGEGIRILGANGVWDCNYTTIAHHNEIYNYERFAFNTVTVSKVILEYNHVHDNLNEVTYQGGIMRGGFGKLGDLAASSNNVFPGSIGNLIRYNVIYNIKKYNTTNIYNLTGGGTFTATSETAISWGSAIDITIHNNIIYNCDVPAIQGGSSYNPNYSTYSGYDIRIYNNTIYNVGKWSKLNDYITGKNSISILDNCSSIINNNILTLDDTSTNYGNSIFTIFNSKITGGSNIFTNRTGNYISPSGDNVGSVSYAIFQQYNKTYYTSSIDYNNTNPNYNNINSTILLSNVGINGVSIPDFRTITGIAVGNGTNIGNDPTGRSYKYDISGYLRNTNNIGALSISSTSSYEPDAPPYIITQPTNQSVIEGGTATFSLSVQSTDTLEYHWWKDPFVSEEESLIINIPNKIEGATTNNLKILNCQLSDDSDTNGIKYLCEVYNPNNYPAYWENSNVVSLTVTQNLTIPVAPSSLTYTLNSNNVTLNWIDNSNNELGFNIYRNNILINTVSQNTNIYIDSNLGAGTYSYKISAYNNIGESQFSNIITFTIQSQQINVAQWTTNGLKILSQTNILSNYNISDIISKCKATNKFSIETWIKDYSQTYTNQVNIISCENDSNNINFSLIREGTKYKFGIRTTNTNNNGIFLSSFSDVNLQFTHLVCTYENNIVKMYINSVLNSYNTNITGSLSTWNNSYKLGISNHINNSNTNYYNGEYALIALYNNVLTESEIVQNYNAGIPTDNINVIFSGPTIISQSNSIVNVNIGDSFTIYVDAIGNPAPRYQWYKNNNIIQGETNSTYFVNVSTIEDSATYVCSIDNDYNDILSNNISVIISEETTAPIIIEQPKNQNVYIDEKTNNSEPAVFSVEALGNNINYQWHKNGNPISNATSKTYVYENTSKTDDGSIFNVVVSNEYGSDISSDAILSTYVVTSEINPIIFYSVFSSDLTVYINWYDTDPYDSDIAYEIWYSDTGLYGEYFKKADIFNSTILEYQDNSFSDYGITRWYYINKYNKITKKMSRKSEKISATTSYYYNLTILSQPEDIYISEGNTATFSVIVTGGTNFKYQWYKNDIIINNAIQSKYTTPAVTLDDNNTNYKCIITNSNDEKITSDRAVLHVVENLPIITTQPTSISIAFGQNATFTVISSNADTYQWQEFLNNIWTDISGQTSNILTFINPSTTIITRQFRCVLNNQVGQTISNIVYLDVILNDQPITIITQPISSTIIENNNAIFTCEFTGPVTKGYQWWYNGNNAVIDGAKFSGGTTNTLTVKNAQTTDSGMSIVCECKNLTTYPATGSWLNSNTVYLTVNKADQPITITTQPVNKSILVGQNTTFSCEFTGPVSKGYQWWYTLNGQTLSCTNGTLFNGSQTNELTVLNSQLTHNNMILSCECKNLTTYPATGSWLNSNNATLNVASQLSTVINPVSQSVNVGQSANFSVSGSGGYPPYTYQWYFIEV